MHTHFTLTLYPFYLTLSPNDLASLPILKVKLHINLCPPFFFFECQKQELPASSALSNWSHPARFPITLSSITPRSLLAVVTLPVN